MIKINKKLHNLNKFHNKTNKQVQNLLKQQENNSQKNKKIFKITLK